MLLYNICYITYVIKEAGVAPKTKYAKDRIIKAAFKVMKEKGWDAVSARTIAAEMKASTMPIYSSLKSMADLTGELRKLTLSELVRCQAEKRSDNPFLDMAVGYVRFAKEEKHLFKFYFLEMAEITSTKEQRKMSDMVREKMGLKMTLKEALPDMSDGALKNMQEKSWIFTHGLACLVYAGVLGNKGEAKIRKLLEENGEAAVIFEKSRQEGVK
jgi:AcrR family transcriptional regulator